MTNLSRHRTTGTAALGAILAALVAASSAQGATYTACVKKKGGAMRLVSKRAKCRASERKISFNSTGAPGQRGLNGSNGINGANGVNGANGTNGATGFTSTLPKGATEFGTWAMTIVTPGGGGLASISFNIPLAGRVEGIVSVRAKDRAPDTECPGSAKEPAAASGHLCIYTSTSDHIKETIVADSAFEGGLDKTAGPWGTMVEAVAEPAQTGVTYGTWAVTG